MKIKHPYPLILLSLIFLANPNMNLIDVLPDCIAYVILALIIGDRSKYVPYLAECKAAVIKLALITAIKIPAFTVMYSNMKYGSDIIPLFTLSFAVLEIILICSAVRNASMCFSYIGERTDCKSARGPFNITRRRLESVAMLEKITIVYFALKTALNVLPEFMLLSNEDFQFRKQMRDAYPGVLVIAILASLLIGIFWFRHARKYAKHVKICGDLEASIKEIEAGAQMNTTSSDKTIKKLFGTLNLFAVSGLFIFDINFQDLGGYNILPHFIYGLLLFCAVSSLSSNKVQKVLLTLSAGAFAIASMINQSLASAFFKSYQYVDLNYLKSAKEDYAKIKTGAVFELVFIIALLAISAIILVGFIKEHTEISPTDPSYTLTNKKEHARLIKTTLPLMILAGIINALKCVNVFLQANVTIIYSAANPEGIAAGGAPGLSTVIFLLSLAFAVYSFVAVSNLKDAVKFKYSKERY